MHLGQWRHFHGIVGDEGGLDELALAGLTKDFVDEFALAHGLVHFNAQLLGNGAYFIFALAVEVVAGLFLDGIEDRQSAIGSLERDNLSVYFAFWLTVHGYADFLQQLFGERHHPVVVFILHIELHAGEFGVMVAVHALVAEVLANLIDTLKATHDEALQVELSGNTHVHILVEGIEVRDERTSRGTTGNRLQGGRLYLRIAGLVEHAAQRADDGSTLQEGFLHALVDYQVDIALAVAQFRVVELVVGHTVLIFNNR